MPQPTDALFRLGDCVRDKLTGHCGEVVSYDYRTRPYTVSVEMDHSFKVIHLPETRLERATRDDCNKGGRRA